MLLIVNIITFEWIVVIRVLLRCHVHTIYIIILYYLIIIIKFFLVFLFNTAPHNHFFFMFFLAYLNYFLCTAMYYYDRMFLQLYI